MDLSITRRRSLSSVVFATLLSLVASQTEVPQSNVYFNGTGRITTDVLFSPRDSPLVFQFRTCTGGELFSQSINERSIAVGIDNANGSLYVHWTDGTGETRTQVGREFNDNLWTLVDIAYAGDSVVLRVRDTVVELAIGSDDPTPGDSTPSGFLVGSGFTGCVEEIWGMNLAGATDYSNVVWGECPLDEQIGCGQQDPCASQPCLNGGECIGSGDAIQCRCTAKYNGTTCESSLGHLCDDPSYQLACANGVCIENGISNGTLCECDLGYGGPLCNTSSTLCDNNPCANGGTCQTNAALDGTVCSCVAGFTGPTCDENVDDCAVSPCLNGGSCQDGVNSYACDCAGSGYHGSRCELPLNECVSTPCQNSRSCADTSGGFYCECTTGNFGDICEEDLCSYLEPCGDDGQCSLNQGVINCTCVTGFTGDRCATNIDDCDPDPCFNNGICVDKVNDFECFCPQGFVGRTCNDDFDECAQYAPCKNGATCHDLHNSYNCTCAPGYTSSDCGIEINECDAMPCTNNATCVDMIAAYECQCIPGYNGTNCEINIDECTSDPCRNGGACVDGVNGFICDCSDTGFDGDLCHNNIDDCVANTCQNNATCVDGIKDYNCSCHKGYEGADCEVDIPECAEKPCDNNGTCLELSNQTLYRPGGEFRDYLPDEFSYTNASGFICVCEPGFNGARCEINIDECSPTPCENGATCADLVNDFRCDCAGGFEGVLCQDEIDECEAGPCLNGGTCSDRVNDFDCACADGWGDKRCNEMLTACTNNTECQNGATCDPFFLNGTHAFRCDCMPGYAGEFCTDDTSVSFRDDQYLLYNFPDPLPFYFTFSFATSLPDGHLLLSTAFEDTVIVEMRNSSLHLTATDSGTGSAIRIQDLGTNLNDGEWHTVNVFLSSNSQGPTSYASMNVTADSCAGSVCSSDSDTLNIELERFPTVYFGHITAPFPSPLTSEPFTGCMRDIYGAQSSSDPINPSNNSGDSETGCSRIPQCDPDPCNGRGVCADLWWTFTCQCEQGYTGPNCETSFVQGTFSYEDTTSYALFDASAYPLSISENVVKLIFRTRKTSGLLFAAISGQDYISLVVINSTVLGEVAIDGHLAIVQVDEFVADGRYHTVDLTRRSTSVNLNVDSSSASDTLAGGDEPSLDMFYVGGMPDFSDVSLPRIIQDSTYFKGCLWDVKYNNYSLEFFPLDLEIDSIPIATNSNVISMCNSDDTCNPEPCENGGVCRITWNDFECDCPNGFAGKNCSMETICSRNPCPTEAECVDRDEGFDCVAPATFDGESDILIYTNNLNISRELSTITLQLRTRRENSLLLHISPGNDASGYFVTLEVRQSRLVVRFNFGNRYDITPELTVADGTWHTVIVAFGDPITNISIDGFSTTESTDLLGTLNDVVTGGSGGIVDLGNTELVNEDYFTIYTPYQGNLNDVRIGTFLLPFFNVSAYNATNDEQFFPVSTQGITIGAQGADVCSPPPCFNGGNCTDEWNAYSCTCIPGYTGPLCETEVDECSPNPCQFSSFCIDLVNGYNCSCTPGYEGVNCSVEIDECRSQPCVNDGTCSEGINNFTCVCSTEFTGRMCEFNISATCDGDPCENGGTCTDLPDPQPDRDAFTCACVAGYEGTRCAYETDYCALVVCGNGGTCVNDRQLLRYDCQCLAGFEGDLCESNVDDCLGITCLNGGRCEDGIDEFTCVCDAGYSGQFCDTNIDDCAPRPCYTGDCLDGVDGYTCDCPDGYEGDRCELKGPCALIPCVNGGSCSQELGADDVFTFQCACPTGFNGTYCENEIDWCDSNPCQQAGSNCTSDRERFYCSCAPGYGGITCETKLPDCNSSLCENGATCRDLPYDYECTCIPGWTGKNCDSNIDDCLNKPCENEGLCEDRLNDFYCDCDNTGYQGKTCSEDFPECNRTNPCENGGTCEDQIGSFKCECVEGYLGDLCNIMDPCFTEEQCENGGTCILQDEITLDFKCSCPDGYSGDRCERISAGINWLIVGPSIAAGVVFIIFLIGLLWCFVSSVRKKRATEGTYSPSRQEMSGSIVEMDHVLKMPPEERLI